MPRDPLAEAEAPRDLLAEQPQPRSLLATLARQAGLTVRAGVQGVTAIPALLTDAITSPYRVLQGGVNVGGKQLIPAAAPGLPALPSTSTAVGNALTFLGVPSPENASERVASDVASAMAGTGGIVKAGQKLVETAVNPLVKRIGEVLATNPGSQIASSASGAAAAGGTREAGGGPVAQLAAGAAGGFVPALPGAAAAAARNLIRGGEAGRQRVADTIQTFEDAGAGTPTVGQATQGRGARAIESALAKTPGAAGRMVEKAEAEAAGVGSNIDDMTAQIATRSGAAPAGRQIKSGLEHFVEDFKAKSGDLYDKLDQYIPQDARVDIGKTKAVLGELNASIPGAPNTSNFFKNSKIKGIQDALQADTETAAGVLSQQSPIGKVLLGELTPVERTAMAAHLMDGKLPYEAVKKLRTLVGNEMSNPSLVSDVPKSKWKALYGALSQDLGAAARAAGPEAEQAMVRANRHYGAGMQRIEDVLQPIVGKGDPEDIFNAALAGTKEGATTLQGVMKSLPEESRKVVAATALRRLGLATPGKQNELGEVFSTESFLTNWNKLHADAKTVLFSTLPKEMRSDLDKIAKVASNIREGSKVFANPSGTAQASANQMTAGAAALSVLTGNFGVAAGIAGAAAAANGAARLMTNPTVVHWLAEASRAPIEQLPAQLNVLSQKTWNMKPEDRTEVQGFIRTMREGAPTREPVDLLAEKATRSTQ